MSLLVFPRLIARRSLRTVLVWSLTMIAVGLAMLARIPVDAAYLTDILPALAMLGICFGVAMPALTTLAMSGVGDRDAGIASGIFNTTQQVSGALGLAAAASLAAARTSAGVHDGTELRHAHRRLPSRLHARLDLGPVRGRPRTVGVTSVDATRPLRCERAASGRGFHPTLIMDIATAVPVDPSDHACIDLVNSTFSDHLGRGEPVERLTSADWQSWFLDHHGLMSGRAQPPVQELIVLRRDLRRILDTWSTRGAIAPRDVRVLDQRVSGPTFHERVTFTTSGPVVRYEPQARDWAWVMGRIAASAVDLMAAGDARRLRTCGNPACSWMFYDTTQNRSKRFCTTTPCASLVRVRRFRDAG